MIYENILSQMGAPMGASLTVSVYTGSLADRVAETYKHPSVVLHYDMTLQLQV